MICLPTFTIKISQMQLNIPYMDPMGMGMGMSQQDTSLWQRLCH